ncbi:probable 5-hydroxyisourate hydrolase [Drosophila innubila]|uniref:probable 5-hydroxyisourate hydrolase n=1 Tax=Drosophila innubila TaxID=198719 RepID=UPI00148BE0DC|nr:probable 5-hydroxyisourate hydrolase [Drosophila innubila]
MNTRKLSTHVLETSSGKAASNIKVTVYRLDEIQEWRAIRPSQTNSDGRCLLLDQGEFPMGIYKLTFHVGPYFAAKNMTTFYPAIDIIVDCNENQNYHIPLLLSPYGYTTYRGT